MSDELPYSGGPVVNVTVRQMPPFGLWWLVTVIERTPATLPRIRVARTRRTALEAAHRLMQRIVARNGRTAAEWRAVALRGFRRGFYFNAIFMLFYLLMAAFNIWTMRYAWSWITVALDIALAILFGVLARKNLRQWGQLKEESDD